MIERRKYEYKGQLLYKEQLAYLKGYRINEAGDVFFKGRQKMQQNHNGKYKRFSIRIANNKILNISSHRFQAYQKFGDKIYEDGIVIRHLDGEPCNNSIDNIEIGSQKDNMLDIPKEVRRQHAINATQYVMVHSADKVKEIREYYNKHHTYKDTMKKFGISSKGTLWFILNKRIVE